MLDSAAPLKTCTKCRRQLPLDHFQCDTRIKRDGRRSICRECKNAALADFRADNVEHVRAQDRQRPRRRAAWLSDWRRRNPESARRSVSAWRTKNPWFGRAKSARREARKRGNGGTLTAADIKRQIERQGYRCAGCGADLRLVGSHTDHVVALANGGPNDATNIQMLCPTCNVRKGVMCQLAFLKLIRGGEHGRQA